MNQVQKYKVYTEYILEVYFLRVFVTQHIYDSNNFVFCAEFDKKEDADEYVDAVRISVLVRRNGWYEEEIVRKLILKYPELFV